MVRSSLIPGFRFHPTDVELVMFYLKRKLLGKKFTVNAVAEVNIYDFSPWDLPDKSCLKSGDLEWFFFCPKSKKYSSGGRSNRSTERGFWKATGKDRVVKYNGRTVATIKTLVFHIGHKGKGERTDWVMHEYKMEDELLANVGVVQDMYVLCKVFKKSGSGPKNGAQYGAPFDEEEWVDDLNGCVDSQVVVGVGPVGASNKMDDEQEVTTTTMNLTAPDLSTVTYSANPSTNIQNIAEVQSLPVTVSSSLDNRQEGLATINLTEQGSVGDPFAITDAFFDVPAIEDYMLLEDLDQIMGSEEPDAAANEDVKSSGPTEDDIYTDLVNLVKLDNLNEIDFKTDGADYVLHDPLTLDDLREFYVE